MPLGSILLGLALALLVLPFVAGPLVSAGRRRQASEADGRAGPEAQKQATLVALRDLDFDFRTGKIVEEDYRPLREALVAQAAAALQAADGADADRDDDAQIESAVRALRASRSAARRCSRCSAPVNPQDKFCPQCGAAMASSCPACHRAAKAGDRFCAHCGTALILEGAPA